LRRLVEEALGQPGVLPQGEPLRDGGFRAAALIWGWNFCGFGGGWRGAIGPTILRIDPLGTPIAISDVLARPSIAGAHLRPPRGPPARGFSLPTEQRGAGRVVVWRVQTLPPAQARWSPAVGRGFPYRIHPVSRFRRLPRGATAPTQNCLDFGWRGRCLDFGWLSRALQ